MNRVDGFRILTVFVLFPSVRLAAQSIPNATATATIAADPKDVASADAIIAALYDANTNLVDHKRGADRFRSLFVPGARLMPTARPMNGTGVIRIQTVDDYVQRASSGPPRHGFSEREIARRSDTFGNITQVFSTYESHRDSSDTHPGRGINSIQLFNDGTRWWVVGVLWDNERPDKPIPAEYLKSRPTSF
ncbi:MAG TPA: hypothetical protein VL524_01530 [Gemmatimonadaceae bacterium]|nr:hypothetical protein [Gemmatimonadaceae bacterium]